MEIHALPSTEPPRVASAILEMEAGESVEPGNLGPVWAEETLGGGDCPKTISFSSSEHLAYSLPVSFKRQPHAWQSQTFLSPATCHWPVETALRPLGTNPPTKSSSS